jgi:hypothetical protein
MSPKQWLLVTFVIVLNIVIFGALLNDAPPEALVPATPTWTPHPTFTPAPFPTATAILMPTEPVSATQSDISMSTPQVHVVQDGETLESIAERYGVGTYTLKMLNRMSDEDTLHVGQELIVPANE